MIKDFQGKTPDIATSVYVDDSALVIGNVHIAEDSSIWPMSVVRGDVHRIDIGRCTNIQDASVLHVTHDGPFSPNGYPLIVGDNVTVGHRVTLHACHVGHCCLIGMSSTIMDGAVIGDQTIIAAGSLVPSGKKLAGGYLYLGSPVVQVRPLKAEEIEFLSYSAEHYVKLKNQHKN